jgi:hypothetical protein
MAFGWAHLSAGLPENAKVQNPNAKSRMEIRLQAFIGKFLQLTFLIEHLALRNLCLLHLKASKAAEKPPKFRR